MPQYHCTALPHDEISVRQWAPKFVEFRLNALRESPDSASSSYKVESCITFEEWIAMLCEPAFRVIIAVAENDSIDIDTLPVWEHDWVCIISLYGPRCLHQPQHQNHDDCMESCWYVGGAFVAPHHRGQNILRDACFRCEQEAVRIDKSLLQRRSGRFRTRLLASTLSMNRAVWEHYCRIFNAEMVQIITVGERAAWGMNILVCPDKLDREIMAFQKIVVWEADGMAVSAL
ncbi:hypothetical protein ASPWEDRAFT_45267 [Aspergillus wentii DTO 134E9]|uniref:N-acetyltransferase domain-containing protein n=1 Tax=Aspergillus wentii DTO 134E9 TaxID=1073089 RepID=A0A1L9R8V9_ASPWE|nr:uncharacterized protein ASPWEDRAFT_45267 [Aspergillus wentii DTO 134E9]OJJ31318.1 hypothetical protein ASPWEDRAFT_45267 [Aspergillus wentii DTO 134E9]